MALRTGKRFKIHIGFLTVLGFFSPICRESGKCLKIRLWKLVSRPECTEVFSHPGKKAGKCRPCAGHKEVIIWMATADSHGQAQSVTICLN